MIPRKRALRALLGVLAVVPVSACSRADTAAPVATVALTLGKTKVAIGSPVDLTYRFEVAANPSIQGDYKVFVHVKRDDGQRMWSDDHDPPVPTSQWKPGQKIEYKRTRFVPVYPYLGEATFEIGLYRENDRLPLQGPMPADPEAVSRSYKVATVQLLPQAENILVIKKNGWHPAEFAPENPTLEWEWTQKVGVLTLRNPRKDVVFYLEFDARTDVFPDQPQQVTVYSGNAAVDTFLANESAQSLRRIPITAAQLGTADMAELRIEVDRTFIPAKLPSGGRDARELGIRVYHAFVEGR